MIGFPALGRHGASRPQTGEHSPGRGADGVFVRLWHLQGQFTGTSICVHHCPVVKYTTLISIHTTPYQLARFTHRDRIKAAFTLQKT